MSGFTTQLPRFLLLGGLACGGGVTSSASEDPVLERQLAEIGQQLTGHRSPSRNIARRLAELSRLVDGSRRGRLLLWLIDQPADLRSVIRRGNFSNARLAGARLAGVSLADRLKKKSLDQAYRSPDYLAGRRIFSVDLEGIVLAGARLDRADLHGANLQRADLNHASLRGANLSGAILNGANLAGADLSGADLRGARLVGTDLRGIRQQGTRWKGAVLARALISPDPPSQTASHETPATPTRAIKPRPEDPVIVENLIRLLRVARCVKSHRPGKVEGSPRLDSGPSLRTAGPG